MDWAQFTYNSTPWQQSFVTRSLSCSSLRPPPLPLRGIIDAETIVSRQIRTFDRRSVRRFPLDESKPFASCVRRHQFLLGLALQILLSLLGFFTELEAIQCWSHTCLTLVFHILGFRTGTTNRGAMTLMRHTDGAETSQGTLRFSSRPPTATDILSLARTTRSTWDCHGTP